MNYTYHTAQGKAVLNKAMENARIKTLRAALREKYGARCYRITRTGEVHIYGQMPRSNTIGWWLMGDILWAEWWLGIHA